MGTRIVSACLLLLLGSQVQKTPQPGSTPPTNTPFVERTERQFNFYPGGKVQIVAGVPGNCKIVGWGRASISLEVEKIVYNLPADQAKTLSDRFPVQVRWTQTSATIKTLGPAESGAVMEANITLHVPKEKTDFDVHLLQGDFEIEGVNGWVELTSNDGNIDARSLQGYFSGVTQKGDVNVVMAGRYWNGLGFTAVTQHGSVQLHLPIDYSAALKLETHEGEISVQYPEQLVNGEHVPLQVVTQKKARTLDATVGDGGAPIKLLTIVGNLQLEGIKP